MGAQHRHGDFAPDFDGDRPEHKNLLKIRLLVQLYWFFVGAFRYNARGVIAVTEEGPGGVSGSL